MDFESQARTAVMISLSEWIIEQSHKARKDGSLETFEMLKKACEELGKMVQEVEQASEREFRERDNRDRVAEIVTHARDAVAAQSLDPTPL